MAYVKDFTFAPSPPRPTIKGYARGGHVCTTPQPYKAGGLAKGRGLSNDSGHTGGNGADAKGAATRGQGDGDVKRANVSDKTGGKPTRTEKSSGVQKPAFAKGGHLGGGPKGAKGFSVGDKKHQRLAISGATRSYNAGNISKSKEDSIKSTARGMLAKGKCSGGSAKGYAEGGRVAAGKVPMGSKPSRNQDDATSPGSFKRTPPGQSEKNSQAANSKFSAEGRNTPVATKQDGDVERMSGYSDFKSGGSTGKAFNRLKNLGHYAHGGKVKASAEKPSGTAGSGKVKAPVSPAKGAGKYESKAGTSKTSPGTRVEMKSGTAKAAMGGLSRGTSHAKNAAIHAKGHKPKASAGPSLGALAGALSGGAGPAPGGPPPMGAPPGGLPGGMPPQAPQMGGAPPMMSQGGAVQHMVVHHVHHG